MAKTRLLEAVVAGVDTRVMGVAREERAHGAKARGGMSGREEAGQTQPGLGRREIGGRSWEVPGHLEPGMPVWGKRAPLWGEGQNWAFAKRLWKAPAQGRGQEQDGRPAWGF